MTSGKNNLRENRENVIDMLGNVIGEISGNHKPVIRKSIENRIQITNSVEAIFQLSKCLRAENKKFKDVPPMTLKALNEWVKKLNELVGESQ